MKLGKKVLSCVLAVMMIVTTISVCFNSFAASAENQLKNLYAQINLDYDGLMDAIDSGDSKRVPTLSSGSYWVVEQDTYHSGWYNVAKTFSSYAQAVTSTTNNNVNSYKDVVTSALTGLEELGYDGASKADVEKILNYFIFNTPDTLTGVGLGRTLSIKAGIDYFAWSKIEDIETDRNYYNATLTFTIASKGSNVYGLTPDGIEFKKTSDDSLTEGIRGNLAAIKSALTSMVDEHAFIEWFKLDFSAMSVDDILKLVEGEGSAASVLSAFSLAASLAGFDDEGAALWDHYVAERVGKKFAETKDWIDNGLMDAIYQAHAASYKKQFEEKMAVDYSGFTAQQVLEHYNSVVEIQNNLLNQKSYDNVTPIFENIRTYLNGEDNFYDETVLNYIAKLKVDVARAYAKEFADEFAALLAEDVPTYDHNDSAAAEAWPGSDDQAKARDFLQRASQMKEKFDTFVVPGYGEFSDIEDVFSESGKRITQADYEKLLNKINTVSIDVDGYEEFANKAKMDSLMSSTMFGGKTYNDLTTIAEEFRTLYNKAVALKNDSNRQALYNAVYPEGIDVYTAYMNEIKLHVIERIYDQVSRIEKYYEKPKKVTFYNFEAILAAYDALEATQASLLTFLDSNPAYVPGDGNPTQNDITSLFSKALQYYNEANNFKTGLNNLKNAAMAAAGNGDINIMNYIINRVGTYGSYGWETSVGKLNVDTITELVNEVGLKSGTVTSTSLPSLMTGAVEDFDRMLISNDLGSILDNLIKTTNEQGEQVGFLGTWKQTYTLDGVRHQKGSEVKNLREFLVNTVIDLLYNGKLLNTLFETIYPLLGNIFADAACDGTAIDISVAWLYLAGVPAIIERGLSLYPHHYQTSYSNQVTPYKFFDGSWSKGGTRYDKVLSSVRTAKSKADGFASWSMAIGGKHSTTASFWKAPSKAKVNNGKYTIPQQNSKSGWPSNGQIVAAYDIDDSWFVDFSAMDENPQETWHLDATNPETLYKALAALFGPICIILSAIVGRSSELETTIASVNATIELTGDDLYSRVFEPLYQTLGITNYVPLSTIQDDVALSNADNGTIYMTKNGDYGLTFWKDLLSPIINWIQNDLFAHPVQTLFGVLPNLLAAIEHNQILPKLQNLKVSLKALGINLYTIDIMGDPVHLDNILAEQGIVLDKGINGLVDGIMGMTATTSKPNANSTKPLMAVGPDKVVSETEYASFKYNGRTYYFTNCGLLAQTIYNLLGDGFIEWMFTKNSGGKTTVTLGNGVRSDFPLNIPVNRFLAAGQSQSWRDDANNTHYRIKVDPGTVILEVFRWIMDDGAWYTIKGLIAPLLAPAEGTEGGTDIIGMISTVIDGQADNLMMVLICLLNEYNIDFKEFVDPVKNGTFKDVNGNNLLGSGNKTNFVLGAILEQTLSETGNPDSPNVTFDQKIAKADLAVENLDKVVASLIPMILTLIGNLLGNNEAAAPYFEKLNFASLTERASTGELTSITQIIGEIASNGLIDIIVELLFGTHEEDSETGEINRGVLGGLLNNASGIIVNVLDLLAEFGLDVTPLGFYKNSLSGVGKDDHVKAWLGYQADLYKAGNSSLASASTENVLAEMSWADISARTPANHVWFDSAGFDTFENTKTTYTNFFSFIEHIFTTLNPILALLLTGEDITLLDELTIRGNEGYSKAIVPILEAVGLGNACMSQAEFNRYIYTGSKTGTNSNILDSNFAVKDKQPGSARFYEEKASPLHPVFEALVTLLIGDNGDNLGFLNAPFEVLAQNIPNIAYMFYMFDNGNGKSTNDLIIAIENLIAPVLKLLDIADPILSRIVRLDIRGLLEQYLDIETLLNELLSRFISEDETVEFNKILDFGKIAAYSSKGVDTNAHTYRNGTTTFTRFEGSQGQFLITIVREFLSSPVINFIVGLLRDVADQMITNPDTLDLANKIIEIVDQAGINLNKTTEDGAAYVDSVTGLFIDLLTDYNAGAKVDYFYNKINAARNEDEVKQYLVEHHDYFDDHNDLDEDQVNDAIANIDYVVSQAIGDVLGALIEEGVLDLSSLIGKDFDFSEAETTWDFFEILANTAVFSDDIIDRIGNLILGLFGNVGIEENIVDMILSIVRAAGFNVSTAAYLLKDGKPNTSSPLYSYLTYGAENVKARGATVFATVDGKEVELTWTQIYLNHTKEVDATDAEGNVQVDENGDPIKTREFIEKPEDGWTWGLDSITGTQEEQFNAKKAKFVDIVYAVVAPLADIATALLAGDNLEMFNTGMSIRGTNGYENVFLPLLHAFGLDVIFEYADLRDSDGNPIRIMTNEEYLSKIKNEDGTTKEGGVKDAMSTFVDYIFYFIEIFLEHPVSTLGTALPTFAYFIYGDGLSTLVQNLLLPLTTVLDRLSYVIKLDYEELFAALVDALRGFFDGSGSINLVPLLDALLEMLKAADGNPTERTRNFTRELFNLLSSFEIDLSGILAPSDEELTDEQKAAYKFSIVYFIDKEKELEAKEKINKEDATEEEIAEGTALRTDAIIEFFRQIAALGSEENSKFRGYVNIDNNGHVKVSNAAVLMFVIEFLADNTALVDVLDNLNMAVVDVGGVIQLNPRELIDNVLQNPEVLVEVIIELLTTYDVKAQKDVELIPIEAETHEEFYEDLGYNSIEEVLEELEKDPESDISQLSRVHTYAAIDNLDALVGTILNLFKDQLVGEGGFLANLGFTAEDDLTLKGIVDGLLEKYAYQDEGLNSIVSMLIGALGNEANKKLVNIIISVVDGAGYSLTPQTIKANVPQLADVIGDAKKWNQVAEKNSQYMYKDADGNTLYAAEAGLEEIDGVKVTASMVQATDENGELLWEDDDKTIPVYSDVQQKGVNITGVEWNIENRDDLVNVIWNLIKPLAPIFETLLTGGSITIYEKLNIRGLEGYKGVILPLAEALNITKLVDREGNRYLAEENFYATYDEFYSAVYEDDGSFKNGELLLKSITDILFAFVDSLCERPVSTILTVIPSLARFIESNGFDIILENLVAPITTILEKISVIYDLDLIGIVKDLLVNLIEKANNDAGIDGHSLEPEDQEVAGAALAAYVLDIIEDNESGNRSMLANVLNDDLLLIDEPVVAESKMTFVDILWKFIYSFKINGTSLRGLIPDTIFSDLSSCVWLEGNNAVPNVRIGEDGRSGQISGYLTAAEITVDRETVLIKLLNWIVFTPNMREIIGKVAGIDFDSLKTADNDNKDLVTTLVYSIFNSPQAVEKLIIALLSWYDIQYKPERVKTDYSEFTGVNIDYDEIGIDEKQLEKLPSDIDGLITKALPAIVALLPEGTFGTFNLRGENLEEIAKNLVSDLIVGSEGKDGVITTVVTALINLIGGNEIAGTVISMLPEIIPGLDLSLKYFKESTPAFAEYFSDCETWADAYDKHKVLVKEADEEAGTAAEYKVELKDSNNFGVDSYDSLLELVGNVLTPLVPVLKVIFSEQDLVALDGIHITAGDGYDRFLVPLLEVLGVKDIMDKNDFNVLADAEYADKVVEYIDGIINLVLESPVQFIVDLIPRLVFFVYSDGLSQSVEQLIAPIITLVDLVNDVLAKRFKVDGNDNELYAIDIYELITNLINNNEKMSDLLGEKVKDLYDLVDKLLSADGLEAILEKLIVNEEKGITLEKLGFEAGIIKTVLMKSCTIDDVETVRHFGAKVSGLKRTVKGVSSNRADTLIGIVSDFVLSGDLIETLLETFGVEVNDTIKGVLDAVTGENRYVIFQILVKYFNEYDVETAVLEYLSFEKIEPLYSQYLDGNVLTARKLRRSIKKLDASINSAIPGLLPILSDLLKDNETFANIINTLAQKNVESLKDVVDELLTTFAFNDETMGKLAGMLVGLLGREDIAATLATVLPIVNELVGINLVPQSFANGTSALSTNISAAIAAAPKTDTDADGNETPHEATWTDVAKYFESTELTWGIDEAETFEAKKDAFVASLVDLVLPLEPILNVILRGDSISILADEDGENAAIEIQGNDGYGTALYELFRILLNAEDFEKVVKPEDYADARGTETTLTAITDALFMVVDELCEGPVEYILTLLPKLSYALSSNGVEIIISNLVAPVLAIYNLAEPVVGSLLEDLIGGAIGNTLKQFMPEGAGEEKTREVTNEETGEVTTETYMVYSIDEILGIAGEDGSNIIGIINNLLTKITVTDEDGVERPIGIALKPTFFTDYAEHTITVNKDKSDSKWYYYLQDGKKVNKDDYDYTTMGKVVNRRYVVDGFEVDVADSLIFLLSTVLSEDIIYAIAHLVKVDVDDSENMLAVILKALANGDMSAYVIADIITRIFEGYEVTYPVHHDKLIETDHTAYDTLSEEQKEKVDGLPEKLDTVVEEAIPALLPMILDLLAPKADEEGNVPEPNQFYTILKNYADKTDKASIRGLVDEILTEFAFKDSTIDSLMSLLVGLLGGGNVGDIIAMISPLINNIVGLDIEPKAFANGSSKLKEYIGSASTWADVWNANSEENADGERVAKPFDWGIDSKGTLEEKKDAFIDVLADLLDPLFPVLQFALQGKKLTIFNATAENYEPVDEEDKQAPDSIGNGYAKITGLSTYEQVLLVLVDALPGTFKDVELKTVEEFNKIDNAKDLLSYVVNDILFTIVNDLADSPISFISENIATLVYFIANDGISNIVDNALSIVNVLLEATGALFDSGEPLTMQQLIPQLAIVKLADTGTRKGLLSTLNDLIANANLGLVLTQDLLLDFAGMLGDYQTVDTLRTTTDGALINEKDRLVDQTGKLLSEEELEAGKGKITTIIGSGKYVITGLLGFVLSDDVLGNLLGEQEVSDIIQTLLDNLTAPDGVSKVVDVLIKLFYKYVIKYFKYNQPELDKINASPYNSERLEKLSETLGGLDNLIPIILSFINENANSLKDIVYPLFVKDDIANLLMGMLVPLLAGLPSDTIDMIVGYVNDLTNLKNISLAPQAFAEAPFESKLDEYIGEAKTWAEVWDARSTVNENGEKVAADFDWGIETPEDLVNFISDLLYPLDDVLGLILTGGTISAFKEINIIGGEGYNHAIIPLLELLGIDDAKTMEEFKAEAAENGSIHYILTAVFDKLDEILEEPIANILPIFANLAYIIGNDSIETFFHNLVAPINELIAVIDPILPIAINIDLSAIPEGGEVAKVIVGKEHPGIEAGITIKASGEDITNLINSLLSGINVGTEEEPKPLGIKLDLNWLELAATAAAEGENGKIKFKGSSFKGDYEYKNVVGDPASTLIAILKAVLTEENLDAILDLLGVEGGLQPPLDSLLDQFIKDPSIIVDLIEALLGSKDITYVPIQNRLVTPRKFDYSKYTILTKTNADLVVANLDKAIADILSKAGQGSLKDLVAPLFATSDMINTILDALVGVLGGDTVNSVLETLANFSKENDLGVDLDLTVGNFYKVLTTLEDYKGQGKVNIKAGVDKLNVESWGKVGSFAGTDWGFKDGDINGFVKVLGDFLTPLNSVLEILLIGEGKEVNILDIVKLAGGNGYDYAIIPLLEAFGFTDVLTIEEYKAKVAADPSQLLGYVLDKVAELVNKVLAKPVDTILDLLPNLAYFLSNDGVYLVVRNLIAPLYSIVEIVTMLFGINLEEFLDVAELLHSIAIGDMIGEILGEKYDLRIPKFDWLDIATECGLEAKEVKTARSLAANSFERHVNPHPDYIENYNKPDSKYKDESQYPHKTTQTYVVSDKSATLTYLLTFILDMFGDQHNRAALTNWLAGVFGLNDAAKAQIGYGLDKMFDACKAFGVSELIVGSIFQILGIAIAVEPVIIGDMNQVSNVIYDFFRYLGSNIENPYSSVAKVMEDLTGVWMKNIGSPEDKKDAEEQVQQSLNWFQRIIKAIRDFFRKLFRLG